MFENNQWKKNVLFFAHFCGKKNVISKSLQRRIRYQLWSLKIHRRFSECVCVCAGVCVCARACVPAHTFAHASFKKRWPAGSLAGLKMSLFRKVMERWDQWLSCWSAMASESSHTDPTLTLNIPVPGNAAPGLASWEPVQPALQR